MFKRAQRIMRLSLTLSLLGVATVVGVTLWDYYTASPWTRNGQIRAQVANIAPRISGQIIAIAVHDNQFVHKGDILYEVDPFDFRIAVASAQARVNERMADMTLKLSQHARRQQLTNLSASAEEKQTFEATAAQAKALYGEAVAALSQAQINLERTKIRSTVNGYITNLTMRIGDFATAGQANIHIIDADSYWVDGYFEETKLWDIHINDLTRIDLIGYQKPLSGHVESITRGIATANATPSTQGLPLVDPVYTWVRLAQRIPVRIKIDSIPEGETISAGMTATVTILADDGHRPRLSLKDALERFKARLFHFGPYPAQKPNPPAI
ncbi:biotin/lipoyl-binding protein [Entomobacter blattae]|uniref:p-hydroxybenzoic acid efflux pump subunit AaeA n=1 Tax=Entomobacter blattae TaxID=2762277 RepID=A0A7H1NQK2_9PROT|nr:HlyD family secretion protein [Entomobacter blattae]QNT78062.1 p-hydroxybenzoic acid efflux pump subunit AaeA [Entomobacter blattae]